MKGAYPVVEKCHYGYYKPTRWIKLMKLDMTSIDVSGLNLLQPPSQMLALK
jgi:hypothetical protein